MPSIETRLDRLRLVYRLPALRTGRSTFDPTRLSFAEQIELDDLLRPLAPLPGERWSLDPLTDAQLDRSSELTNKAHGIPPSPPYRSMPHRDPGIGPCRCADCEPTDRHETTTATSEHEGAPER